MGEVERVRVVVVGDSGVGKTSLTWLLAHDSALPSPAWTIGCSVEVTRTGSAREAPWCR